MAGREEASEPPAAGPRGSPATTSATVASGGANGLANGGLGGTDGQGEAELQTMGSSPSNPVPNPDENSLSHPQPKESQYMLADKVVDQWDDSDTENSSGSASYQVVSYKNAQGENTFLVPPKKRKFTIDTYAVECSTCQKWRIIPSKLKYEKIRENIVQVPFSCKYVQGWKPQVTCHDPTDMSEGNGMVWAIDKPGIPHTPPGWERKITLRSEQGTRFAHV
ncbi:hypothetical protein ZWY2020_048552 [Hordeum vulgare]|nr:hypothetical protein ZWY2020_048552 [Hordeum vulgare]